MVSKFLNVIEWRCFTEGKRCKVMLKSLARIVFRYFGSIVFSSANLTSIEMMLAAERELSR